MKAREDRLHFRGRYPVALVLYQVGAAFHVAEFASDQSDRLDCLMVIFKFKHYGSVQFPEFLVQAVVGVKESAVLFSVFDSCSDLFL